jgi:hypothetical protein
LVPTAWEAKHYPTTKKRNKVLNKGKVNEINN